MPHGDVENVKSNLLSLWSLMSVMNMITLQLNSSTCLTRVQQGGFLFQWSLYTIEQNTTADRIRSNVCLCMLMSSCECSSCVAVYP